MYAWLLGLSTIAPSELHEMMQREPIVAIDVNAKQSWIQARVPGARHLDPYAYRDADLPRDKQAALVFYCANWLCRKAPMAARRATSMGYRNVRVLSSGISGWLEAGLPTEAGDDAPR